jgi:CBS domain containing-hemolysin-like protein
MTVLITNTAINVAIFAVSYVALGRLEGPPSDARGSAWGVRVLGGLGVLLAVIVCGEMLPKGLALAGRVRFAPLAAGLIGLLQAVVAPIRWLLATLLVDPVTRLLSPASPVAHAVSTEELRLLVEESARAGVINSKENEMLQAVIALADASVCEVMTPRVDLQAVRIDDDHRATRSAIKASGRRRLPVYGRNLDDIRGVLRARDLYLNPRAPIRTLVRPIHFLPEQANLVQLIRYFREEGTPLAIVVDEYGGTAGLVSIQDVAARIVGDLPDEDLSDGDLSDEDRLDDIPVSSPRPPGTPSWSFGEGIPAIEGARGDSRTSGSRSERSPPLPERIDENTYRLSGDLSVRVWADHFGVGEIDRHIHTVAGLILARLGRLPRVNDTVRIRNLALTVEAMRNRRIDLVLLRRVANGP